MNRCRINGVLTKTDETFGPRHIYHIEVLRSSQDTDSLLVISERDDLPEGKVTIEGHVCSDYFRKKGVFVYIVPDDVWESDEPVSETTAEGVIKNDVVPRLTKKGRDICTLVLITDDGHIPVILWGRSAKKAAEKFRKGDTVTATGRLQRRDYPLRNGGMKTTYEISVGKNDPEMRKLP